MFLFKKDWKSVDRINSLPFQNENEVHELISPIIPKLFKGAVLLANEFIIPDGRIDALAYHPTDQTFLIVEYKANSNHSIHRNNPIDQVRSYGGVFYDALEFAHLNDKVKSLIASKIGGGAVVRRENIRLIVLKPFVQDKPPFTVGDTKKAKGGGFSGGKEVELWGIRRFENNLLFVEQFTEKTTAKSPPSTIHHPDPIAPAPVTVPPDPIIPTPATAIPASVPTPYNRGQYTEQHFTDRMESAVRQAYERYKEAIKVMCEPNILDLVYKKNYINFESKGKLFSQIIGPARHNQRIFYLKLNLNLKADELVDTHGLTRLMTKGHLGNGEYEIQHADQEDFNQVMDLIRQAYDKKVLGFSSQTTTTNPTPIPTTPEPRGQYDEQYFTNRMIPVVRQAYERYKEAIAGLCQPHSVKLGFNRAYINFEAHGEVFASVIRTTKQLQLNLNLKAGELNDPEQLADLHTRTHHARGDYRIYNAEEKDFDQVMALIRQAYNKKVLGN